MQQTKTIFITGSSSGIGKATALLFARKDWNVIATMRAPEKEVELLQFPNVICVKLDVLDSISIREGIAEGMKKFGGIDIVVNNAGFALVWSF